MLLNEKKQNGGTVLGSGGFGCVISPPLKCKNHFNRIPYSIDKKYISKIVEYIKDDAEMMNEIEIGKFYELIKHQHPKCTWVKIPQSDSVGYKTIQCYLSDFKNLELV